MLGDYLCRALVQVFGYIWPAYQCYKAIEQKNEDAVREWCIYWFIMALFVMAERVLDFIVFWVPLYYEAKLVFVIWLWYPASKGAVGLYTHTLQPFLAAHEASIDRQLAELRGLLGDTFTAYYAKSVDLARGAAHMAVERVQNMQPKPQEQQGAERSSGSSLGRAASSGLGRTSSRNLGRAASNGSRGSGGKGNGGGSSDEGPDVWKNPLDVASAAFGYGTKRE